MYKFISKNAKKFYFTFRISLVFDKQTIDVDGKSSEGYSDPKICFDTRVTQMCENCCIRKQLRISKAAGLFSLNSCTLVFIPHAFRL